MKHELTQEQFDDEVLEMAYDEFRPYRCEHCGHAVKYQRCCGYCGSSAPNDVNDKDRIWKKEE